MITTNIDGIKNPVILRKYINKPANGFKDISGNRFGRLVAIEWIGSELVNKLGTKRKSLWLCQCDCGVNKVVRGGDLGKKTSSCGCYSSERTIAFNIATKTKQSYSAFSDVWQSYKLGAKKRGYSFNLSKEEFRILTSKNCHYCGIKPLMSRKFRGVGKIPSFIFNGIDRVDNSIGYELENCVSCCTFCNRAKGTISVVMFIDNIKRIYENLWNSQAV